MYSKHQVWIKLGIVGFSAMEILAISASSFAQTAPNDRLFKQRCTACHSVTAGGANRIGPNLRGVVGRQAGSTNFAYSLAMKRSTITWTSANLDRYLSNPTRMMPGTRMVVSVPDDAQRAEIVRYLATAQ